LYTFFILHSSEVTASHLPQWYTNRRLTMNWLEKLRVLGAEERKRPQRENSSEPLLLCSANGRGFMNRKCLNSVRKPIVWDQTRHK
jgi:hypothetical protein